MSRGLAHTAKRGRVRTIGATLTDGIAWLTLERADAGNSITPDMAQALCDAAEEIEANDGIIAVVLSAAGADFCRGVDAHGDWERRIDWVEAIARLTRPVVAAIDGAALGEGLELALACDLRVVSDRARFAMPQLMEGRLPCHGGTQRLPRIVGRTHALDLLLTGRTVTAAEAESIGLVSRVAAHRDFRKMLDGVVGELRAKGPLALRYAKEAVLKGSDLTLDQGMRLEEDLYVLLQTTRDRQAGIGAFLEKRKPVFRGK